LKYRLRDTTVRALQWHGDHTKKSPFSEIEQAFGIEEKSGRIHRLLNGVISVSDEPLPGGYVYDVMVHPGQWIVRGLKERIIVLDDDLFQTIFKPLKEKSDEHDRSNAEPIPHPSATPA
jgi:hypothetical protein